MSNLFFFWPTTAAVIGTFSLLVAFPLENGGLFTFAIVLFALVLAAMHVYLRRPSGFLQPVGFILVLIGLLMIVTGLVLVIQEYQAIDPWVALISPGLHIVMPIGMTMFGFAIYKTALLPGWSRKLPLLYGLLGCVGILPAILHWAGQTQWWLGLGAFSRLPMVFGWIPLGVALSQSWRSSWQR